MCTPNFKNPSLIGGLFGAVVLGVPILSSTALAAPNPSLNPYPKIYYEKPYNSRLIVPQNCLPNAITQFAIENPGALRHEVGAVEGDLPGRNLIPNQAAPADAANAPGTVGQRPSIFNEPPYNRANPLGTAPAR